MVPTERVEALGAEQLERVLVAQHRRFLELLRRRTGSAAEAEDVLHAAYVRALEKGLPDADDEGVVAWFHQVLRNALVDRARRGDARRRAAEREAEEPREPAPEPGLRAEICACLHDLLPALKAEYADVVREVDLHERPVAEVARAAGITANSASVRLHRARRALKEQLLAACGACAAHGCLECSCRGHRAARPG